MNDYYEELGMTDAELIEKHPFTRCRSMDWKCELLDQSWYPTIPKGWRKAFGKQLIEEMEAEYNKYDDEMKSEWNVLQIKEKYGELRIYVDPETRKMGEIINKYSLKSRTVCIECGAPAKQRSNHGWVDTMCDECYDNMMSKS